jgi:hypothetical protein
MSKIADASHTAYKRGDLDAASMETLTRLAWQADKGDRRAASEIDPILADGKLLRSRLKSRSPNPAPIAGTSARISALAARLARGG